MLAARLYDAGDLRVETCEKPKIEDNEILLRTSAAAICGTDLRMIAHGAQGVHPKHPLILGHEVSGIIEHVGPKVQKYQPGMKVALAPNIGCGICDTCVAGNTHLCNNYRAFGINIDGGFAEFMRIPANAIAQGNILILNNDADTREAAIFEPLACVVNGQEQINVKAGDTVLIIGAGPIGLMHARLAEIKGALHVYIYDLSKERMVQAKKMSGNLIPIYETDLKSAVLSLTNDRGVDVCIVACPSGAAQAESLELMAMNGRILFFGGLPPGSDKIVLQTNLVHYRQLKICGSTRSSLGQYRFAAQLAASGKLRLNDLISARFNLTEFHEAIDMAEKSIGFKTVITFD